MDGIRETSCAWYGNRHYRVHRARTNNVPRLWPLASPQRGKSPDWEPCTEISTENAPCPYTKWWSTSILRHAARGFCSFFGLILCGCQPPGECLSGDSIALVPWLLLSTVDPSSVNNKENSINSKSSTTSWYFCAQAHGLRCSRSARLQRENAA